MSEQEFEEWWKEEGKEMKFYAGEYIEHRGIAKEAYLAATDRAVKIAEEQCICKEYDAACYPCKVAAKIRGEQ